VARRIGTSRRQLQRVFAELSDRSFRDTIAAVRMAHARKLLAQTDRPIAEIGRLAGYHQPAQFSKAFRHHHGTSPRVYRQRARGVTVSLNGNSGRQVSAESTPSG
jgi:transcriptional regulator GlxA family with amidase domain